MSIDDLFGLTSLTRAEDAPELEADRDKLEAYKLHMWIQRGREAFSRAYATADAFVEKTEGKPDHPWYLHMQLTCRNRDTLGEE